MVRDNHAHLMTAARQRPSEQCLLNRFTADPVVPVFRRHEREIIEPDEADLHGLVRCRSTG